MNNSLNFKKKFTIPKLSKIADDILKENNDRNMIIRTRPGSVIPYDPKIKSVKDLILRLMNLSGYKENGIYVNQTQKLRDISIIDRIYKLLLIIYRKKIKIDILDASNLLGILAFIVFNTQNVQNYFTELNNYILYIKDNFKDDKDDDIILLSFLYDLTEYKKKPNKPANNVKNYDMFIKIYKSILIKIIYKQNDFITLNKKVQQYMKNAKNKANANAFAKAEQNKANAIAKAEQNKANAIAKAEQNKAIAKAEQNKANVYGKKCHNEWQIYQKYKTDNPRLFDAGIRPIKRPTCGDQYRFSNQTKTITLNEMNKNKNKTNTLPRSNTRINNLKNNKLKQPILIQ
jgi:hypothetical protein